MPLCKYTKVLVLLDGVVTKAGQTLNSNQAVPTVVVLAQLDTMRVRVQITVHVETDVAGQDVFFRCTGTGPGLPD